MSIRPATLNDLYRILDLEQKTFTETAFSRATFLYYMHSDSSRVQVIEYEGVLAGYVVYTFRAEPLTVYVDSVAVRPEYRRQGMGRRMMDEVRDAAAGHGAQCIKLHVRASNERAIDFYIALGYERAGGVDSYYRDGEDACIMRLDLSD